MKSKILDEKISENLGHMDFYWLLRRGDVIIRNPTSSHTLVEILHSYASRVQFSHL